MCYVFKVPSALSHNPSSLQMPVVDMKRGYSQTDMVAAVVAPWPLASLIGLFYTFCQQCKEIIS